MMVEPAGLLNPVTGSFDMLVRLYLTTQCHITDGRYLNSTVN